MLWRVQGSFLKGHPPGVRWQHSKIELERFCQLPNHSQRVACKSNFRRNARTKGYRRRYFSPVLCQMLTPRQLRHSFRASHQSKSVAESITITVIRWCAPFSWIGSLLTDSLQHALLPEKTLIAISQSTSHWARPTRSKSRWFCRMTWRPPTLWSTCPRPVYIHIHVHAVHFDIQYTMYNIQ